MGHFIASDGKIYVDTDFINSVQRALKDVTVRHMGFGEFTLDTPDGEVEFDRMRGKPFEGQSGRAHQMYDSKGGQKVAEGIVKAMEKKGASTLGTAKAESVTPGRELRGLVERLRSALDEAASEKVAVSALAPQVAAAVKKLTKKRQIYVSRETTTRVSPSTHAPEYDNFDYSYYLLLDLGTGSVSDLRADMEPFPKGQDKTVSLTTTQAVISGDRHSGYLNLHVHPEAQI